MLRTDQPARLDEPTLRTRTGEGAAARRPAAKTWKRRLFDLHSWLGFQLVLLFSLVLITGTLATLSHEIDWLASPDYRVSPQAERASWEEMHAAARAHAPDEGVWWIALGPGDRFAATAVMVRGDGTRYNLRIDPYTGQVTGPDPWLNAQRFLRDLHRYLFLPGVIGLPIVSTFAVILVFQLYSGLVTTPGWRKAAVRLRTGKGARIAVGDAHKAGGIWGSWFLVLMAATGIWYFAEFVMQRIDVESEVPYQSLAAERPADFGAMIPHRPLDAYVAAATAAFPELEPRTIRFPFGPDEPFVVEGFTTDPLVRERANEVWLDPATAEVLHVQRSSEMSVLHYMTEIADPLHFGTLGGLATKLIWFLFGAVLSALAITGTWLAWKRLRRTTPTLTQWATLPVIIVIGAFGSLYVQRLTTGDGFVHALTLRAAADSPLILVPHWETDADGRLLDRVRVFVRADQGGVNVAGAELTACGASAPARVHTAGWSARLDVRFTGLPASCDRLALRMEFGNGVSQELVWADIGQGGE